MEIFSRFSLAVLALGIIWIGANIYKSDLKLTRSADFLSMVAASNLIDHGIYSSRAHQTLAQTPKPTRDRPPGYPFFLAAVAQFDSAVGPALRCYAVHRMNCDKPFQLQSIIAIQYFLSAVALLLAYLAAIHFSGSIHVATLTTILVAIFGKFDRYAELIRPGSFFYVLIFAALYFTARACRSGSGVSAFFSGCCFGLAGLFNPFYILAGLLSTLLFAPALRRRHETWQACALSGALPSLLGLLLILGLWATRSIAEFGDAWMFRSYLGGMLAQRVAFNAMEWQTWIASFVFWLPTYGDALAGVLFREEVYEPLKLASPTAYIGIGNKFILPQTIAQSGGMDHVAWYLVTTTVLQDFVWHTLTTLPLFLRGILGAGDLPTIAGLLLVAYHLRVASARRETGEALLLVLPLTFAMMVQAALTPNIIWQCLPIIFVFSYIVGRRFGSL